MRFKANTGASNTGLFKEVKAARWRWRHKTTDVRFCRSPHSPKVLVSRSVPIGGRVLAPFHSQLNQVVPFAFSEWSLFGVISETAKPMEWAGEETGCC
jgi:hypothetical protein